MRWAASALRVSCRYRDSVALRFCGGLADRQFGDADGVAVGDNA